jgi:protein-S-isoprenylcysteine O-methyltransferase Ste14
MALCLLGFAGMSMLCLHLVTRPPAVQPRYLRPIPPMLQRGITIATIVLAVVCLPAGLLALALFTLSPSPFPNVTFVLLAVLLGGGLLASFGVLALFLWQMRARLAEGTNA